MPGNPAETRSYSGRGATRATRSSTSFGGGSGYLVATRTRSATMAPPASRTDAFSPVPPMSMARVQGRSGRPVAGAAASEPARPSPPASAGAISPALGRRLGQAAAHARRARQALHGFVAATLPVLRVQDAGQRGAAAPSVALEVRDGLKRVHRADAEPGHRADRVGDAEQLSQVGLAVERHPAHAPPFGRAGQPQVLDGQAHRVEAGVRDG